MTKKKFRKKGAAAGKDGQHGTYWMYGLHACVAALDNPEREVLRIAAVPDIAEQLVLIEGRPQVEVVDTLAIADRVPPDAVHQGLAVQVKPLTPYSIEDIAHDDRPIVFLDQVTDPHNVGAILRSAAAFDAAGVVITKDHAPKEGAVMAKSASGGLDLVPLVQVINLAKAMDLTKEAGYWIAGMDGGADKQLHEAGLGRKTALVMGAEGKGMRRLTEERCDLLVKLPIHEQMESLNVSNAAAIALYELSRAA